MLGNPPDWCPLPGEIWQFHEELGGDIFCVISLGPFTSVTDYESPPTSWDDVDQVYVEAVGADGKPIRFWTNYEITLPGDEVVIRVSPLPAKSMPCELY